MMPKIQKREEAHFLGTLLLDNKRVLHDTIDGEVLAVCSDTGTYYSLRGIAAEIWSLLAKQSNQEKIISQLRRSYADPENRIGIETARFIDLLISEGLLIRMDPEAREFCQKTDQPGETNNKDCDSEETRNASDNSFAGSTEHQPSLPDLTPSNQSLEAGSAPSEQIRPWLEPQLEIYSDMQDLLLFDPIHEVDPNCGWPKISDDAR